MGLISMGMVYDMLTENYNDGQDYPYEATQADMDKF